MYHTLFINSPNEGYLGCFQVSAFKNKAPVYTFMCRFWCEHNLPASFSEDQGAQLLDFMWKYV